MSHATAEKRVTDANAAISTLTEAKGSLDGLIDLVEAQTFRGADDPRWPSFVNGLRMVSQQIDRAMHQWSGTGTSGDT